jgi:alkaline phosphatase D
VAGRDTAVGRTRTAPEASADVQVNLAWISCQDYEAGYYGAFRQMLLDDDARPPADKIHFVMHLGDVIYETREDSFQTAIDDNFQPISLPTADGGFRSVQPFPSGGGTRGSTNYANTVDDYRHLYARVLSATPTSRRCAPAGRSSTSGTTTSSPTTAGRAMSNYSDTGSVEEPDQPRRLAASQAWFEYMPVAAHRRRPA